MTIFHMILDSGAALAASYIIYEGLRLRSERERLERARMWYEEINPSTNSLSMEIAQRHLCGGCGQVVTPQEIDNCVGEKCPRYLAEAPKSC